VFSNFASLDIYTLNKKKKSKHGIFGHSLISSHRANSSFSCAMLRLAAVFAIFLAALAWLYVLATNAPSLAENERLEFPSSLEDLKRTAAILSKLFNQVEKVEVGRA
jgi:hypothetical protein